MPRTPYEPDGSQDREIGRLAGAFDGLAREMEINREQQSIQHAENSKKLDAALGLKPVVDEHTRWIRDRGEPTARLVENVAAQATGGAKMIKYAKSGLAVLGTGSVAAAILKGLSLLATAVPH